MPLLSVNEWARAQQACKRLGDSDKVVEEMREWREEESGRLERLERKEVEGR